MNRIKLPIQPDETAITGSWEGTGDNVEADSSCRRIRWLISAELKEVAVGEWDALYRDPNDNRYWVLSYPQGHLQGAGPPELRVIGEDEAIKKFNVASVI